MTETLSRAYKPKTLTVTRGEGGFYVEITAYQADGTTLRDLTGGTVSFRADSPDYSHVIEKVMTSFTRQDSDTPDILPRVLVGPFTEEDTRGIDKDLPLDWEAQWEKDGAFIVFAGGKLKGKGGSNRDAP